MRRFVGVALLVCGFCWTVWAGVAPRGTEFRVNGYTTESQASPSVASDAAGNFVVVWSSRGQDGSGWGVFGLRFDSAGTPAGADFLVNTCATSDQDYPHVASDAAGNFVVVWQSLGQDGSFRGVFGRRFDSTGAPTGPEFQVNTYTDSDQGGPSVASDPNGNFVVVWQSWGQDGSKWGVFGQRFDSTGASAGAEFQVNTYTTGYQVIPSVASDANGDFVVVWTSTGQDGSYSGIFGRLFDSTGTPLGPEFQVNTHTTSYQYSPSVASDADGNFVVVWQSWDQDSSGWGVLGQRFDSTGALAGTEFQVNTYTTSYQQSPSVASDADGNFVVTWTSYYQDGSEYGVFGQRFFGRSPTFTSPLAGDTVVCSNPRVIRPTLTWDDDGYDRFRVFIGWDPAFGTGHQVTSGDTLLSRTSWTPSAKKWRKACANALAVNPTSPRLYIKIFGVDRSLSKSDPARKLYSTVVQVNVQP